MPARHVDRPDPDAGAQHRAENGVAVGERHPRAFLFARFIVTAAQPRLGDADRRQPGQQAEMAGDAEAPRMGDAVPVDHQQVGRRREPRQRGEPRRRLAERQQAGNVGEARRLLDHPGLDHREIGIGQHDDRRAG